MKCPTCRHEKTRVIDTRSWLDNDIIRARQCVICLTVFTTTESIDDDQNFMQREKSCLERSSCDEKEA